VNTSPLFVDCVTLSRTRDDFETEITVAQPPNPFEQQRSIPGVKHIVAISSGKGGVGKSTVSANLALALVKSGARVGLLDADIYGPSIPRMFGALNQKPELDANRKLLPIERLGVRLMSIGFLVEEELAVVWRGPMLFKAMDQFFRDVAWGELDYLLIDLPPGTGDIQLSLAQKVPVSGAIAVTTPQNVALTDVKKAIDMWTRTGVPILGMIENMAWLEQNGQRVQLFPRGSLESYLTEKNFTKLGEVPFNTHVATGGEAGIPVVESHPTTTEAKVFISIAAKLRAKLPI
jgi:ATP-binding protein involved in chromosome partitioning